MRLALGRFAEGVSRIGQGFAWRMKPPAVLVANLGLTVLLRIRSIFGALQVDRDFAFRSITCYDWVFPVFSYGPSRISIPSFLCVVLLHLWLFLEWNREGIRAWCCTWRPTNWRRIVRWLHDCPDFAFGLLFLAWSCTFHRNQFQLLGSSRTSFCCFPLGIR